LAAAGVCADGEEKETTTARTIIAAERVFTNCIPKVYGSFCNGD
jgi:hypothetical protein